MAFKEGNRSGGRKTPTLAKTKALMTLNSFCERAAEILCEIADNPKAKDRLKAAELALAYGIGRPTATVELTGKDGKDLIPSVTVSVKQK